MINQDTDRRVERPILIVDSLNLFIRNFVANPTVSAKGEAAGGIVGFLGYLASVADRTLPKKVILVWEGGGSARKREIFNEYKAHRKPERLNRYHLGDIPDTVDNRNAQIRSIISLVKHLPVVQIYVENCEADDVIGYICRYKFPEDNKVILSSDKDFYQLLNDKVKIYNPHSKRFVNEADVLSRFNISPQNFCIAKAICGDVSDNVPGVEGVGFKTVAKRFPELASPVSVLLEEILTRASERLADSDLKALRQIVEQADIVRRNWQLMHLDTSNLSASQIKKIDNSFELYEEKRDKIGLMRGLIAEGLPGIDADPIFRSLSCVERKQ